MTDLRLTFNTDADAYERYRPHYPPELYDTLVRQAKLARGAQLLEIGPGTGQATREMAARGFTIMGIELGEHLAAKARSLLKDFPNVQIITGAFEEVDLPAQHYDLIYAATSFHWIKPEAQFARTAPLLKDGGHLAIIHTVHVSDEDGDAFFKASHSIYKRYEKNDNISSLPKIKDLTPLSFDQTLFELVSFTSFPLAITYTAAEFAGLISTYSPTIALSAYDRASLLRDLQTLVNQQFGGTIKRHFAMTLTLLKKNK